jgi:hypothetical protein
MNKAKKSIGILLLVALSVSGGLFADRIPSILGRKEQTAVIDGWLVKRLNTVLPEIMRREKIDMWIVVSRENNVDPVFLSLVPGNFFSSWRTHMLVFFDRGKEGVERISVSRNGAGDLYKEAWEFGKTDQWSCLGRVVKERKPKRIGINEADDFSYGDGLTVSLKRKLVEAVGPEYASRFCSAENLAVGWLERRIPEEIEVYSHLVSIAHGVLKEALSRKAVMPGVTTTDDLSWWLWDRNDELHLHTWAQAGVWVDRPKDSPFTDNIIRRGDLVQIDYVFDYLNLSTDVKACAYVLREGETDVPAGLKKALANGNRVQDILIGELREGLSGDAILAAALGKIKEAGLKGTILAHPIGNHGHAAGAIIGRWDHQQGVPGVGKYPLFADTCHAIELTATTPVPEWGDRDVTIHLEEDAVFTKHGTFFLDGRQTDIIAVK